MKQSLIQSLFKSGTLILNDETLSLIQIMIFTGQGIPVHLDLRILLPDETRPDVRRGEKGGLQRSGIRSTPGRLGRELPHVCLPQRKVANDEGKFHGERGRSAGRQTVCIRS